MYPVKAIKVHMNIHLTIYNFTFSLFMQSWLQNNNPISAPPLCFRWANKWQYMYVYGKKNQQVQNITKINTQILWIFISNCDNYFSHFHLDHCGALPYMSEMVGYDGPIYMTHPTKAICPILLVIRGV